MCYDCGSAERPSVRIMNDERKKERKKESTWNGKNDEIITLYLSSPLLSSENMEREERKERKRAAYKAEHNNRNSLKCQREYRIGFGSDCFCYPRHSGVSMSVLFPSA